MKKAILILFSGFSMAYSQTDTTFMLLDYAVTPSDFEPGQRPILHNYSYRNDTLTLSILDRHSCSDIINIDVSSSSSFQHILNIISSWAEKDSPGSDCSYLYNIRMLISNPEKYTFKYRGVLMEMP